MKVFISRRIPAVGYGSLGKAGLEIVANKAVIPSRARRNKRESVCKAFIRNRYDTSGVLSETRATRDAVAILGAEAVVSV